MCNYLSHLCPPLTYASSLTDTESQIRMFKAVFDELQAKTKCELMSKNRSVKTINAKLLKALPSRLEKDYHKFVHAKRGRLQNNLEELFDDLNAYCWNCFEYELLEFIIISNSCHPSLQTAMQQYSDDIRRFKQSTAMSRLIGHGQPFLRRKSLPKRYKKLTTNHDIDPKKHMLVELDNFQEDMRRDPQLSECTIQVCGITEGSVQVQWAVSEECGYALITFFCDETGKELLQQYQIKEIFIDDVPINQSVCYMFTCFTVYTLHGHYCSKGRIRYYMISNLK